MLEFVPVSYKVDVVTDDHPDEWRGNFMRFATEAEAHEYAFDIAMSWDAVTRTVVVPTSDPVNAQFIDRVLTFLS